MASFYKAYSSSTLSRFGEVLTSDFNHDGLLDIAFRGAIYLQQADHSFVVGQTLCPINTCSFLAKLDLNHDGTSDLVGAGPDPNRVYLWTTTSGPAAQALVTGGDNQSTTVNTAFAQNLQVRVVDAANAPVLGVPVTFIAQPANGSATNPLSASGFTNASGYFSAPFSANGTPGCYSMVAQIGNGVPSVGFNLCNTPSISLSPSSGSLQNTQVNTVYGAPLQVRVLDTNYAPVSNVPVQFVAPASGASVGLGTAAAGPWSPSVTVNSDGAGYAQVYAKANGTVGLLAVVASSANVGGSGASFVLSNTPPPGAPAKIMAHTPSLGAQLRHAYGFGAAIVFQLQDVAGVAVPSGTLVLSQNSNPTNGPAALLSTSNTPCTTGTVGPLSVPVDASGNVTVYGCANTYPGSIPLVASLQGNSTVNSASVILVNSLPPSSAMSLQGGAPQTTPVTTAFSQTLQVQVVDAAGLPIPQVAVHFDAPVGGASAVLSVPVVSTDQNGIATVTATANGVVGSYQVVATTPRGRVGTLSVPFALTNTALPVPPSTPNSVPVLPPGLLIALSVLISLGTLLVLRRQG